MLEKFVTQYCKLAKLPYYLDLEQVENVIRLVFEGVDCLEIAVVVVVGFVVV